MVNGNTFSKKKVYFVSCNVFIMYVWGACREKTMSIISFLFLNLFLNEKSRNYFYTQLAARTKKVVV